MKKTILILCATITILSCAQSPKSENNTAIVESEGSSPKGYDLSKPVKYDMPEELLEISGITFKDGDNSMLYAEQDESGKLFYFKLGDKEVKSTRFGPKGDYEDVAVWKDWVIMLRSDGKLYTFPLSGIKDPEVSGVQEFKDLLPSGEYESLYADEAGKLYLVCKTCKQAKGETGASGYVLQVASNGAISQSSTFSVDVTQADKGKKKKKNNFRPSALSKNPVTGDWYILSSINKMLVVADAQWKVKATYELDGQFLQPEGLTFDKQGNMYISNEGDNVTNGNVLMFKYGGK